LQAQRGSVIGRCPCQQNLVPALFELDVGKERRRAFAAVPLPEAAAVFAILIGYAYTIQQFRSAPRMFVIQAQWDAAARALECWAESSDLLAAHEQTRPVERRHVRAARAELAHPFAAPAAVLATVLWNVMPLLPKRRGALRSRDFWLPADSNGVLPSADLRAVPENAVAGAPTPALRAVSLPAYRLAVAHLALLDTLLEPAPEECVYGATLHGWRACARLARSMVARGRLVPALRTGTDESGNAVACACWLPAPTLSDEDCMDALAQALPPAAVLWPDTDTLPDMRAAVRAFVGAYVRALTQHALGAAADAAPRPVRGGTAIVQQWARAICSAREALRCTPDESAAFARELAAWTQPAFAQHEATFHTCFQLVAPLKDDKPTAPHWRLHFLLQSRIDPSVLVPAEEVWRADDAIAVLASQRCANPQERLLEDLGRAARWYPLLTKALAVAHPTAAQLTTAQAYEFMRVVAPTLKENGFNVLLPNWWRDARSRLQVTLQVRPRAADDAPAESAGDWFGFDTVVDFDWQLAVGDLQLDPQEFAQLAALKVPLVRVRGQWVELATAEIERAIGYFEKLRAQGTMTLGAAMQMQARPREEDGPVFTVQGAGALADVLARMRDDARVEPVPIPRQFHGTLRPYQERGVAWLAFLAQYGFGACLADDMGLGKTVQVIAHILCLRPARAAACAPWLIVCPMSVVSNWAHELRRFAPTLKVWVHHGADRLSGAALMRATRTHAVVITTYALVQRDAAQLQAIQWHGLVLDEAQNIKNPETKQAQAVRALRGAVRIALTGTPVENRLSDLWSIMEALNPGYLGSLAQFTSNYVTPIERYHDERRAQALRTLVQPFLLRRMKSDPAIISDLPEKNEMTVYSTLTREQATLYQAVVNDMLEKIEESEGITRRGLVLAALTKLKQVCNHPAHFLGDGSGMAGRSGKLQRLEEMLREALAEDDRALIFTQFQEMGALLHGYLRQQLQCGVQFLHGGTAKPARDAMVAEFQRNPHGPRVFILSLKAGGTGLNLTAAHHVFHFDRWWNPAVEDQATDRAFRIGQTRAVQVHKFVCTGTLEERIDEMIRDKRALAQRIVGSGEQWITEMSTAQLRKLLTLGAEAIVEE
jgi:SNF2 family DNA or RNA helicase